jgi:hypothetical protein
LRWTSKINLKRMIKWYKMSLRQIYYYFIRIKYEIWNMKYEIW